MKIAFNKQDKNSTLGPYVFLKRLIQYFKTQKEVEIVRQNCYHDIHFITISGSGRRAKQYYAKKVLRIDGIYHDLSIDSYKNNEPIKRTYHSADGIVYQCYFAQTMLHKHFGLPKCAKHEIIIPNGVDASFSPNGEKIDYGFKYVLIASARWQPHKRLSSIINSFLALNRKDVGLVILGDTDVKINHSHIKYLGTVKPQNLPKYYRSADIMLHYAFVDWCPNSVVEGLRSGLPVITTHNGGTPELIKNSGIIIKSDPDYDMEFIDFQKLPPVNTDLTTEAINTLLSNKVNFVDTRPDLSIEQCGEQYLRFFRQVLEK